MAATIGLDIGSSAVRAVQVTAGRGVPTLERLGQVTLPQGAIRDGDIAEAGAVVDCLRALWSRYGFKGRKVALGLANAQVVVRTIDLPWLPEAELRQSLPFQVQDYIPIPVDQALLDHHVLEQYATEDGQRYVRLLLVAAQRASVDVLLDVVRQARLVPTRLDLDAFAVVRSLAVEQAIGAQGSELILDVGAEVTNVVVHEAGIPRFVRILLLGGNAITEGLQSAFGMSHEAAENTKLATTVPGPGATAADETTTLVAERAGRFVDEIRGSLDFYQAQAEAVPVSRVVLTGGGSQLAGLPERLSAALGLPVDRGHPMQQLRIGNIGLDAQQLVAAEPHVPVAVGLALGPR